MKLPLFQKIEIETNEVEKIVTIFKKNAVSSCPTILLFDHLQSIPVALAIKACKRAFEVAELNPLMPYPTYIVTQQGVSQHYFPEVKSVKDAPKHYLKKIKKVKKREAGLLAKATTFSERILNHNLTEDLNYIKTKARDNKSLKKLCSEKNFYLNLLEDIKSPPRQTSSDEGDQG